jgi:F-type H+-transporting ATPase subunit b
LNTIRNSEELCKGAIDQLEKSRARLREVEMIAGEIQVNGDSQIEREKEDLINVGSENLEQLEDPKNETVYSKQ